MSRPDFDRLRRVNVELRALAAAKTLSRDDFERLLVEAKEAVGARTEYLEGFLMRGAMLGFVSS